jgi:hypothetical protein
MSGEIAWPISNVHDTPKAIVVFSLPRPKSRRRTRLVGVVLTNGRLPITAALSKQLGQ